ncbi:D-arabinitol 4-dehydrogenase [Ideonella sp. BN130291]|uniref:D-arabinitol 4-dehydrogenase n=1 Tax=Ideonella sp. BN130291 TaxID=3112940 RepID=UPI002E2661A5|nr:D-arabinitol 4-dehydrogenase [Ideonella sp. BN130291]
MSPDASSNRLRILHLGLGAFHRAHQAVYLHQLIQQGDTRWQLAGTNLRPDMADTLLALQRQGGAYTLETVSPSGQRHCDRITSITEVIPHEPKLATAIARAADPSTRIVSFTVTEAGYYLDDQHRLDLTHPDVAADLAGRSRQTIYGAATAMLEARMRQQAGGLTLLNCDNLRHNGDRFRDGLLQFIAALQQPELLDWVHTHTSCPNAMVDRITPRPAPELKARIAQAMHWNDEVPVMAEDFIQWVIEDRFCNGRPAWETVGVQMVADVQPYEEAKIRILNASHSCIAWAGTLRGLSYIHEGTQDPVIRRMAHDYVTNDVIPCLHNPRQASPVDLGAYRDTVLQRFGNRAIADTNQRVAADGFAKIPGFIVPTIRERLAAGQGIASVARLPALFLAFLQRWHEGRLPYAYQDQAMNPERAHAICAAADPVQAFSTEPALWGELAGNEALHTALAAARREIATFIDEGVLA